MAESSRPNVVAENRRFGGPQSSRWSQNRNSSFRIRITGRGNLDRQSFHLVIVRIGHWEPSIYETGIVVGTLIKA